MFRCEGSYDDSVIMMEFQTENATELSQQFIRFMLAASFAPRTIAKSLDQAMMEEDLPMDPAWTEPPNLPKI